jgi:hypothetical protein
LNEKENQVLLAGHDSFESRYLEVKDEIVKVRPEFEKNDKLDWDEVEKEGLQLFQKQELLQDKYVVASDMQQGECDDEHEGIVKDLALEEHVGQQDFGVEMNVKSSTSEMVKVVNLLRSLVDDPTFFGLVRKLSVEQRLFYNHVLFCVQRFAEQQLKSFLTGGAGMGKSVLTSALFKDSHVGTMINQKWTKAPSKFLS